MEGVVFWIPIEFRGHDDEVVRRACRPDGFVLCSDCVGMNVELGRDGGIHDGMAGEQHSA